MTKPCLVLTLIILNCYSYFILSIAQKTKFWHVTDHLKDSSYYIEPDWKDYMVWAIFYSLVIITIWSLATMVWSSPGYVPNHHKYDTKKMTEHDQLIYENLKRVLHST